jgi:hypothetical protein
LQHAMFNDTFQSVHQCSQKQKEVSVTWSEAISSNRPRSSISFSRILLASSIPIGKSSTTSPIMSTSSVGKLPTRSLSPERNSRSHQSRCWGGTFAVEMIGTRGATRNLLLLVPVVVVWKRRTYKARIFRCPGFVGSASLKLPTQCWKPFGKAMRRSSRVKTDPSSWTPGSSSWKPKIRLIP